LIAEPAVADDAGWRDHLQGPQLVGLHGAVVGEGEPQVERAEPVLDRVHLAEAQGPRRRDQLVANVEARAVEDLATYVVDDRGADLDVRPRDDELGMPGPIEETHRVGPVRRLALAHARDQVPVFVDDRRILGEHLFLTESVTHPAHARTMTKGCDSLRPSNPNVSALTLAVSSRTRRPTAGAAPAATPP
jgi:hypothetical protein